GSGATIAGAVSNVRYQATLLAMEARQTGVTRATVLSTAAMRGFSAAIAANPIGATIVAVAALAAGVHYLNQRFSEGARAERKLQEQSDATAKAFKEYEDAARKAA